MPSDFAIHSDLLVHWTGKDIDARYQPDWSTQDASHQSPAVDRAYLHRLRDILQVGFWMTAQESWVLPSGEEVPSALAVCFTELKLSQSRTHAIRYGRLGIAVKRPFLFDRGGRPVVYFQHRGSRDTFLEHCVGSFTDRRLLQFFKPMDDGTHQRLAYELYAESEWRLIADSHQEENNLIIDPRTSSNQDVTTYFSGLSADEQSRLYYLVPLDGWLAAIIYPSLSIKNDAQQEGSEVQRLLRRIARADDHAHRVEGDNFPLELDLDLCRNF
jgi:hypothetical protein